MEEEDRSDVGSDDNIASQTVVQNLELLITTLQSHFRFEIAIVCDDIGKQSAAVKILWSAVKETAREMKDLKVLMTTMSERIDKLTEDNRALREQTPVPATQPLPPPPSTPPPRPKRKWTGPQTPHKPAKQLRNTSHTNSHALGACGCGNRPRATPAINICYGRRARTSLWRHG